MISEKEVREFLNTIDDDQNLVDDICDFLKQKGLIKKSALENIKIWYEEIVGHLPAGTILTEYQMGVRDCYNKTEMAIVELEARVKELEEKA